MIRAYDDLGASGKVERVPCVVTIGNFDGLHEGHRCLLREADRMAECFAKSGVKVERRLLTFSPHPKHVLGDPDLKLIYTDAEREDLVEETGLVDRMITAAFTPQLMHTEPEAYVTEILKARYGAVGVVIGDDFHFGNHGAGTPEDLKRIGEREGIKVCVVPRVVMDGAVVSSTRIRALLETGDMEEADRLLGRPYYVEGKVTEGKHLGREVGTPTVNLKVESERLVPLEGVYASRTIVDGKTFESISNVGSNPTFGDDLRTETYIFDFDRNLYGKKVRVELLRFIRPEQKFEGAEALKKQLQTDIAKAKEYFTESQVSQGETSLKKETDL